MVRTGGLRDDLTRLLSVFFDIGRRNAPEAPVANDEYAASPAHAGLSAR